ncbi:hypothetical protein [Noviherbaspirillum saxi]|uniref:8-oxoguanine DNA glycosylase n=1 Tax=Noviherbaspirillum saxi TaxID=2320863 RepID=UPI0011C4404A|nr:hypothetical protein [Noviherbaspirillum saxi]
MDEQLVFNPDPSRHNELRLPPAESYVMPGIQWGRFDAMFTPAYWATQVWIEEDQYPASRNRLGDSLLEETVACVLGGHGMPAEICLAAYKRIRDEGVLQDQSPASEQQYLDLLAAPIFKRNGTAVHYRFARQKAAYLANIHAAFCEQLPPHGDLALRDWLISLPGIGPKTASWIVRNHTGSDHVAILDIHIYRAGLLAGFFDQKQRIESHYAQMENQYLEFASAICVRASVLDGIMWSHMRQAPTTVRAQLSSQFSTDKVQPKARPMQLGLQFRNETSTYTEQGAVRAENIVDAWVAGRSKRYAA